jgi:hypothetical protein
LRPDTFNKPNKPTSSFYSTTNQLGIVFSENRLIIKKDVCNDMGSGRASPGRRCAVLLGPSFSTTVDTPRLPARSTSAVGRLQQRPAATSVLAKSDAWAPENGVPSVNTIKMIAYRAKTAMAAIVRESMSMSRPDEARTLLRSLYKTEVDLIPDHALNTLTVRLQHSANASTTA